jgi:C terminal of Calcineurin-like phosphoesterase/N terminal of Calcineurin-like phosphoesterase/Calcineurin-like phosphoesterase
MPRCFILLSLVCLCCGFTRVNAHDGHKHEEAPFKPTGTARGIVFQDANGNGVRDQGETGLPDIRVSNGHQIVKTDAAGKYELPIDDDTTLFVIKPRGWKTKVNEQLLPVFYYTHKPAGSPQQAFAGVAPTGKLPDSVDFGLMKMDEPDQFKALFFGDPQPRDVKEVEYMTHDIIEPLLAAKAHDASFGVTLGDIVFDDLSVMKPHNQAIALLGIPWYNVIGNHDMNYDSPDDKHSDETFESIYGPNYYSFDHGPVHFLVLDDVTWMPAAGDKPAHYHGGLGKSQMEFIRNDLALIPADQLVVLMMHIPLVQVEDRQELYRLIEKRPFALSVSAHTHYQEHVFIGGEDGWQGPQKHHHVINVTVCGSWWTGLADERGIPHATMSDGAPNGYSIFSFDGQKYSIDFRAASKPADEQMNIHAPESIAQKDAMTTVVLANIYAGSERSMARMRVGSDGQWLEMERIVQIDPDFVATKAQETRLDPNSKRALPEPHPTPHMWRAMLPADIAPGTHFIEVETTDTFGHKQTGRRVIRIDSSK